MDATPIQTFADTVYPVYLTMVAMSLVIGVFAAALCVAHSSFVLAHVGSKTYRHLTRLRVVSATTGPGAVAVFVTLLCSIQTGLAVRSALLFQWHFLLEAIAVATPIIIMVFTLWVLDMTTRVADDVNRAESLQARFYRVPAFIALLKKTRPRPAVKCDAGMQNAVYLGDLGKDPCVESVDMVYEESVSRTRYRFERETEVVEFEHITLFGYTLRMTMYRFVYDSQFGHLVHDRSESWDESNISSFCLALAKL